MLVVDKIGKNFSGDGMDPNISGRFVQPQYCSGGIDAEKVVILDLSDETTAMPRALAWRRLPPGACSTK